MTCGLRGTRRILISRRRWRFNCAGAAARSPVGIGPSLALPHFINMAQPKHAPTVKFAWHGREQTSCRGRRPGLASTMSVAATAVGRPQRSCAAAMANTSLVRGRCPRTPVWEWCEELGTRDRGEFGVQAQRPCVGGVPANTRASDRCGLPSAVEDSDGVNARRGDEPGRGACSRPCQAMGGGRQLGFT